MLMNKVALSATARHKTHHMVPLNLTYLWQLGQSILQHCSSTGAMVKLHVLRGPCAVELLFVYKIMYVRHSTVHQLQWHQPQRMLFMATCMGHATALWRGEVGS